MGPPPLNRPLTPEMQAKLVKIRFCVIGVFFAAVGRLATGDKPYNELICGIIGVFLLHNDPWLMACYSCLASSPLGSCAGPTGGGLSCLMPFLVISSLNCLFMVLRLFSDGPFLLISFCCQCTGAVIAWRLNQLVTLAAAGDTGAPDVPLMQPPASMRMFAQSGGLGPEGSSSGQGGRVAAGHGFVAFQGAGQRLDD